LTQPIPPRLQELIDERVFSFAQEAQSHYKTNDLVVLLDLTGPTAELEAIPRQRMVNSNEIPQQVREKLAMAASEVRKVLGSPNQSFWFFVIHENGDAECVAINASMSAPGGNA
jgi:hypothetical protein